MSIKLIDGRGEQPKEEKEAEHKFITERPIIIASGTFTPPPDNQQDDADDDDKGSYANSV